MSPHNPSARLLIALSLLLASVSAQSPRPRLLFTPADLPSLQARMTAGGPAGTAYGSLATSAAFQTSTSQGSFYVQRSLRRMSELALRYQLTQNVSFGNNAKTLLLQATGYLTPTGNAAYLYATYPAVMAVTYDMIHGLLAPAERTQVIAHLESWVNALRNGSSEVGPFSAYSAAVDNFSFSWCTGIVLSLLAIQGESNYPNLSALVAQYLQMIHDGWKDAVSPDGSVDESYGYANYGAIAAINAAIAGENCGYGDYLAGTNILKTPTWYAASLKGQSFLWTGDSSPSHKGTRLDPTIMAIVSRTGCGVGLWGLNRLFAIDPPSDYSPSHAWSPHVNMFLRYPVQCTPVMPEVLSMFFRDNLNEGSASGNKTAAYFGTGTGGHAILHNSVHPSDASFTGFYMIRDEWMNHGHEDDGHFSLGVGQGYQFLDVGYAAPGYAGAQSTDHNIVVVAGDPGFGGASNNHYAPPAATNGRFLGRHERSFFSRTLDYVRGSHEYMWMMNEAQRSVVMIKDPVAPYAILVDRVMKDGGVHTYRQLFHSSGPAGGAGTVQNPMTVSGSGSTLKSVWLSPPAVTVVSGPSGVNGGVTHYKNRVEASGADVNFLSIHGASSPLAVEPLPGGHANTVGGLVSWTGKTDRILSRRTGATLGDSATSSDARFVWIRTSAGSLSEWALAEGAHLAYQGSSLFSANQQVDVSARQGRVDIGGADPSVLSATLWVPFAVSSVAVDGVPVSFSQNGGTVQIGGSAGSPFILPPQGTEDRAYTFLRGITLDGVPSSNFVVTASERGTSSGGVATFGLKGLLPVGSRPFSLAMDVSFLPGAVHQEAGFKLVASQSLEVVASPLGSSSVHVAVIREGSVLGACEVTKDLAMARARIDIEFHPGTGQVVVRDGRGVPQLQFATTLPASCVASAFTTPYATIDNITLFDSDEDGTTPQGVAFYNDSYGVAGFVLRMPALLFMQDAAVIHAGQPASPGAAVSWFLLGQMTERIAGTYGATMPVSLREAGWEFAVPCVYVSGPQTGIYVLTAAGTPLYGGQQN